MLAHEFFNTWHSFGLGLCLGVFGLLVLWWDRRDTARPIPRTRDRTVPGVPLARLGARAPTVPNAGGRLAGGKGLGTTRSTGVAQKSLGSAQTDLPSDPIPLVRVWARAASTR
jgi:hypothetical protein